MSYQPESRTNGDENCGSIEPPKAIIIGAGVAGLTAAHELAVRGFKVHVVERAQDERFKPPEGDLAGHLTRGFAAVGGLAKSEYTWVKRSALESVCPGELEDALALEPADPPGVWMGVVDLIADDVEWLVGKDAFLTLLERRVGHITFHYYAEEHLALAKQFDIRHAIGAKLSLDPMDPDEHLLAEQLERMQFVRHFVLMPELATMFDDVPDPDVAPALITWNSDYASAGDAEAIDAVELVGEHGYRYFPSFYYHVFDTMRRIPVRYAGEMMGFRTVHENLCSNDYFVIGLKDGELPRQVGRKRPESLVEVLQLQRVFQERLGIRMGDILRYQVRLLQYATSCRKRREALRFVSWRDYLRIDDGFSDAFRTAMDEWPQALVGLNGATADAHTFGNIIVQQLVDQVTQRTQRDATLNGPTTEAWFDHWRLHLVEDLGVTFHNDEAVKLVRDSGHTGPTGEGEVRAEFTRGLLYEDDPRKLPFKVLPAGAFLVLATSPHEAVRLTETLRAEPAKPGVLALPSVFDDLQALLGTSAAPFSPKQLTDPNPATTLKHYLGVQFFLLDRDLPVARGHMYFPKAPWGLSAISQLQYRAFAFKRSLAPGCLSVDIGSFVTPAATTTGVSKTAWECTRQEIAKTVWDEIVRSIRPSAGGPLEFSDLANRRVIFYIPRGLSFGEHAIGQATTSNWIDVSPITPDLAEWQTLYTTPWFYEEPLPRPYTPKETDTPKYNNTPYLAQPPLASGQGPGTIDAEKPLRGYDVVCGNLVACGAHMNTFTRLNCMEAANESGRHAVNGILRKLGEYTAQHRVRYSPLQSILLPGAARSRGTADARAALDGYCDVVPLEWREPDDIRLFKDVDERLFDEGLPHFLEILQVDTFLKNLVPSDDNGPVAAVYAQAEAVFDGLASTMTSTATSVASYANIMPQAWVTFLQSLQTPPP